MWSLVPTLASYESFISPDILRDEKLIKLDSLGNYRVSLDMTEPLLKLYILNYWSLYRESGISEHELWLALNSIDSQEGNLKFSINGLQINYMNIHKLNSRVFTNVTAGHSYKNFSVVVLTFMGIFCFLIFIFVKSIVSIVANTNSISSNPYKSANLLLHNLLDPFNPK